MKELVNKLNEARKAYYFGEQSPLSDREYDALYDRLVSMEVETGIILPGSPTQEVGYTVVSELSKVKHEQKALSLDKTKDVHFLETWLGTQDGVLSWKMDGMRCLRRCVRAIPEILQFPTISPTARSRFCRWTRPLRLTASAYRCMPRWIWGLKAAS